MSLRPQSSLCTRLLFLRLLPCSHSVSLSRPRSRRHLSMTRHSTRPLMSQFLTSRLMHKHRPFLHIAVTILISRCAHVPSRWPRHQQRSRRHRRACQFRRIYLRLLREMSARPDEQCAHITSSIVASMRASLKDNSPISSLSLPALPSGCRSCKRGPLRLTRLLPTLAKTLPPYKPHQCPLSRPQEQVPSGPCPCPQGQQSLCLTGGRPRPSLPAT